MIDLLELLLEELRRDPMQHDREIYVRDNHGGWWIGSGRFVAEFGSRALKFPSIDAARRDASAANVPVSFWEEQDGQFVEVKK